MFNFFSNKKVVCPIDLETEKWMTQAFAWLINQFGEGYLKSKNVLVPDQQHFPIRYDGTPASLSETASIVAAQMDINLEKVNLQIYDDNIHEVGQFLWTSVEKNQADALSHGLYFDKDEKGRYDIFIERANLSDPENLVATLAHEFSHIKILGERRLEFNDENLTDLTTVVFGLGVFNANAAFREVKSADGFGYKMAGYLTQREWGYAIALYTEFIGESNPDWLKYLGKNVRSDVEKSLHYIRSLSNDKR